MPTAELAERVSILEVRMEGLYEAVRRAEHKAETSMGRQDFLAKNLTEVRTTVNRIEQTQQDHGKTLENHGRMLEDHGRMLEDHGKILRQILSRLDKS
jgi:ABC-type transporter Mla subunit MlaD